MAELEEKKGRVSIFARPKDENVNVEFVYVAPSARGVALAGSFNNWDPKSLPMKKDRKGRWKTTIKLAPGRYEYKYFADGSWVTDMQCTEMTVNIFGSTNCVVNVGPKMAA